MDGDDEAEPEDSELFEFVELVFRCRLVLFALVLTFEQLPLVDELDEPFD